MLIPAADIGADTGCNRIVNEYTDGHHLAILKRPLQVFFQVLQNHKLQKLIVADYRG